MTLNSLFFRIFFLNPRGPPQKVAIKGKKNQGSPQGGKKFPRARGAYQKRASKRGFFKVLWQKKKKMGKKLKPPFRGNHSRPPKHDLPLGFWFLSRVQK